MALSDRPYPFSIADVIKADPMGLNPKPIPMILNCPSCGTRHIDEGVFARNPHHTHACQSCGMVWRPAVLDTVGVQFLPGFKNGTPRSDVSPTPVGDAVDAEATVEGRLAVMVEEYVVTIDGYTLSDSDKGKVAAALRKAAERPHCHAGRDGDCFWQHCPQNIPGNHKGHCPLDKLYPDEDEN